MCSIEPNKKINFKSYLFNLNVSGANIMFTLRAEEHNFAGVNDLPIT